MNVDLKRLSPANPAYLERFLKAASAPDSTPLDPRFIEIFAKGTPASRLIVLLAYANQASATYKIDSVVILGGGPPKPSWRDYLETLPHLKTLLLVMQMVRDPKAFAFGKGMARILNGENRWRDLLDRHLIYPESRAIMRETFTGRDYTFLPRSLLDSQGIRVLMIGGERDLFVTKGAILRAAAQWGGDYRVLPMEHTDLAMDSTGVEVGGMVVDWIIMPDSQGAS
jgi:hypothetical protein